MNRARKYLYSKAFGEIPNKSRWYKSYGNEKEYELKNGIHIKEFGFSLNSIPNSDDFSSYVYPPDMDVELFARSIPFEVNIRYEYVKIEPDRFIMCQDYVDRDCVEMLLADFNYKPVYLSKFGKYYWCVDGTHRISARSLRGTVILAKVTELTRI